MREKNTLASRMMNLGTESAFGVLARANELEAAGRTIIHCEIGQPDFKTPAHILRSSRRGIYAALLRDISGQSQRSRPETGGIYGEALSRKQTN